MKKLFLLSLILMSLTGCTTIQSMLGINYTSQQRSQSSIVEYLYPNNRGAINIKPDIPHLNVPLRVGIAFVPEACGTFLRHDLNEELKSSLLKRVSAQFENMEIIEKVKVIPSTYLRRKGSFTNLRDIKKQFDIDIMVLLSYDQVQYTEKTSLSIIYYWTVVGRYIIKGDKNDSITLIDAAVYDIDSEKLLFKSDGNSTVKSTSASAFMSEELRLNSQKGFDLAIDKLIIKLDTDINKFKERIKRKEVAVNVSYSSGGGSIGISAIMFLIMLAGLRYFKNT